ncbi:transposase [Paludisphaera sp.]|uniref:transposase n=1 Tax=Paludisphaera sp. TaxID=2017432 RepID=UPI00301CF9EF
MPVLLTDKSWEADCPTSARASSGPEGRPPRVSDRRGLADIPFVLREGLRWQSLPAGMVCGSGSTCWRRFAEWTAAGVREAAYAHLLVALGERGLLNLERAVLDSASTRP